MPGEGHRAVIGGDSRDEAEDTNQEENRTNNYGGVAQRQPHRVVVGGV
jgi:hypothetical protein